MILYVNGDSYTAEADSFSVYSNSLAKRLGVECINKALPGSSNDRIFRTTLEDCLRFKKTNQQIFVLLGLSFVTREEVWPTDSVNEDIVKFYNPDDLNCKFVPRDKLTRNNLTPFQVWQLVDEDTNTQYAHFFYKLYMFVNTLENMDIPYFIFSGATNVLSMSNLGYILGTRIHQDLKNRNNIADLFELSIPQWAEEHNIVTTSTGHLKNTEGHSKFADYLYENYLKSLWVQNK